MNTFISARFKFLWLIVLVPLLWRCYLPDEFKAEIRIAGNGDYAISYQGVLTWVPVFANILHHKLVGAERAAKLTEFEKDLRRDKNFSEVSSLGNGQYRVKYERTGHFKESEMVTFVRRNAAIITIKALKNGTVTVAGSAISPHHAGEITKLGLGMRGTFRVVTGAAVIKNNAMHVSSNGPFQVYDWQIDSETRVSPKIVIKLP